MLALLTAALELWGGGTSLSLALLGDAWHVSSDVVVYAVAAWGNYLGMRNPVLAREVKNRWAIRNANVLIAVAAVTATAAMWRMFYPAEILAWRMFWVSFVGLGVNVCMYFVLKKFSIEHEYLGHVHRDHLHGTAILHTATDTGLSGAVVITAVLLLWRPELAEFRLDSLASLAICGVLVAMALKTKREIQKDGASCAHDHPHR